MSSASPDLGCTCAEGACAEHILAQLAGGIAHQLSTPVQSVAANLHFLTRAWTAVTGSHSGGQHVGDATIDPEFAREEGPAAIQQSLAAIERMAELLRTMKEWSDPGDGTRALLDPCDVMRRVVLVTEHRFRYTHELRLTTPAAPVEMRCNRQQLACALAQVVAWVTALPPDSSASELLQVSMDVRAEGEALVVEVRRGVGGSATDAALVAAVKRAALLHGGACEQRESQQVTGAKLLELRWPLCA